MQVQVNDALGSAPDGGIVALEITGCKPRHSGNTNGRHWTIYEVTAAEVDTPLVSFDALPHGQGDYHVERREHPKYGVSFTLKPVKPRSLEERLSELEEIVAELVKRSRSGPVG